MRTLFCMLAGLVCGAAIVTGMFLIQDGNPVIALFPILISPISLWCVRRWLEYGQPGSILNIRTQSWAFIIGDIVVLPAALLAIAFGWQELARRQFQAPVWLSLVALVAMAGFVIAWTKHEAQSYASFGESDRDRIGSPSKLWHDRVVYGSLSYLLVWGGAPVLITQPFGCGMVMVLALLAWAALGVADGKRKLQPSVLHPRVQDTRLG